MFFKTAKVSGSMEAIQSMESQREDIKRRMAVVEEVSSKLTDAVKKTQELSSNLADRVDRELKIAKKSLTSISAKLNEGLVMIDSEGKIVHLNRVGSKILGVEEKDTVGKVLNEIISCANPIHDGYGQVVEKPIMQSEFFRQLSDKIFARLAQADPAGKYLICNDCLRDELPFCFAAEAEAILGVKIIRDGTPISLNVTLSVLDNDPESIKDVTYIFLFNKA